MKKLVYSIRIELENKSLLVTHMLTLILVSYFVFQYYGAYYGTIKKQTDPAEYIVNINFLEEPTVNAIEESTMINGFKYLFVSSDEYITIENDINSDYFIIVSILGSVSFDLRLEGTPLDKIEDENSIYIPYSQALYDRKEIGDKISINNTTYTIVGTLGNSAGNMIIMPLPTLLKSYSVSSMNIALDANILTQTNYLNCIDELNKIFGDNALIRISDFDEDFGAELSARKTESTFLFLLGTICIVFVYSYILSKRIRRFSVCSFCGASKKDIVFIIFLGSLVVFTVGFVVAAFIGKIINLVVFEPIFGYNTYSLNFNDFMTFYFIMVIIYFIVMAIYVTRFIKNTAVNNYRRSE